MCLLDLTYGVLIMARGNEGVLFLYKEDGETQLKIDDKAVLWGMGILPPLASVSHRTKWNLLAGRMECVHYSAQRGVSGTRARWWQRSLGQPSASPRSQPLALPGGTGPKAPFSSPSLLIYRSMESLRSVGGGTAAAVGAHTGRHGQCWTESAAGALLTLIVPEGGTGASCCLCWKTNGALFQNFSCAANVHCNCKRSQTRGRCFRPRLRGRGAAPMRRCGSGRPSGCAL